jgi:hypothetical protein
LGVEEQWTQVPPDQQMGCYLETQREALNKLWIVSGSLVQWFLAYEVEALTPQRLVKKVRP